VPFSSQIYFSKPGSVKEPFDRTALAWPLANMPYAGIYWSTNGTTSVIGGDGLRQSRIRSARMAKLEVRCTPAACMRMFAVSRISGVRVPLASMLAKTENLKK
jgi:hypothetical protein